MLFGLLGVTVGVTVGAAVGAALCGCPFYVVAHEGATLYKTPPHQLDERLRNFIALVVAPVELGGNPHEVAFGAVQAGEIIQCPQDFIQFVHVPTKQFVHV
jgi:hypothetical protein